MFSGHKLPSAVFLFKRIDNITDCLLDQPEVFCQCQGIESECAPGWDASLFTNELTGNLDTANGNQVMEILLRLAHQENRCVIVVTHDMDIAAQADETWHMRDGRLEEA